MSTAMTLRKPADVGALIMSDDRLPMIVPRGDKLERIAQVCILEARRNPELLKCDPVSVVESVARIMAWGLEVGETAYLVPFGGKCQPVRGYQGIIQLMYDTGHVRAVDAHEVCEGDLFEYEYGLDPKLVHRPQGKRGAITHFYCVIRLPHMQHVFRVMTAAEVDEIRQEFSKQWKRDALPRWYGIKTVIIHTAKLLPKTSKFARVHEEVAQEEASIGGEIVDIPPETPPAVAPELEATDGEESPPVVDDETWARGYCLPGKPESWGGNGGKRLDQIESLTLLNQVHTWAVAQGKKPDGFARASELEAAVTTELSRRAALPPADLFPESVP